MDPFNTYDVLVSADQSVINATDISISANIFGNASKSGSLFELVHCLNGGGIGCVQQKDGPGIVHSELTDAGFGVNASGSGLLFTITYQVVSSKIYTPITMQNATTTIAIQGHEVSRTIANGRYGTAPDFRLDASPSSLTVILGSIKNSSISLTSLYNFNGTVKLATSSPANGIKVNLNPNQTRLHANAYNSTILTVTVNATASASTYELSITGVSGDLTRSVLIHLKIVEQPDFSVGFSPGDLLTHQSSSNSTLVTVTSQNNFTGIVDLRVDAPPETTASFDQTKGPTSSLFVPNGQSISSTLTVTTQSSPNPFRDNFNITASSTAAGTLIVHTLVPGLVVEPPPPDFQITANPPYASIQAGDTESVTVAVTSEDYYLGRIFVIGETSTGLGFSFDPGNFSLAFGQTKSTTLRITTNSTSSPGIHTFTLTVFGIAETTGATTRHSIQLNLQVNALSITPVADVRTLLGLQEPVFFAVIISLTIVLAVLGVFESRRSRRSRRRTIMKD